MRAFLLSLLLLAVAALPAGAEGRPSRLSYVAYVAGLRVFQLEVTLDVSRDRYRVDLAYRNAGLYGALSSGQMQTVSQGRFVNYRAVPQRFSAEGVMRGKTRATTIDYEGGMPIIRTMLPPNEEERETVPPALRANTMDAIGSVATLVRQVDDGRGCSGSSRIFDGRRLSDITARDGGTEMLTETGRSSFTGLAQRCDFEGRLLAGFMLDDDKARAARPQSGSAWLARVLPNGPPVPVRITFHARWLGDVTLYLTGAAAG